MTEKQGIIVGVGALAAVFLLKARKTTAAPKGVVKPAIAGAAGHPSGSLLQPSSTNLATGYGNRTSAQVPSVQGFGANVLSPIASIFSNFARLFGPQQAAKATQQKSSSPTGGTPGGGSGGSSGGGGATRPGAAVGAGAWTPDGYYVGPSSVRSDYDPTAYQGINPYTGLYDPAYDPSIAFNPESGSSPLDPSMVPGQVTIDENGQLTSDAPALGADGGDDPYAYFGDQGWGDLPGASEVPPLYTLPTVEGPTDLGAVNPSMLPVDGSLDLTLSDDVFGGGGSGWDESADWGG